MSKLNPMLGVLRRHEQLKGNVTKKILSERKHFRNQALEMQGGSIQDWADTRNFLNGQADELERETPRIYCSITGQPIGTLSLEMVNLYRKSRKAPNRETLINHLTLVSQPAPHWLNRTPETLRRNLELDPRGFLVYLLDRSYGNAFREFKNRPNGAHTFHWKESSDHIAWYRIKTETYQAIQALDIKLVIRANRALAWADAKLGLAKLTMPFSNPLNIVDSPEALRIVIHFVSGYLEEFNNDENAFNVKYHPEPNRSINTAIMGDVEKASIMTQKEFMNVELTGMLMASIDDGSALGEYIKKSRGSLASSMTIENPPQPKPDSPKQLAANEMLAHFQGLTDTTKVEDLKAIDELFVEANKAKTEAAPKTTINLAAMMQSIKAKGK